MSLINICDHKWLSIFFSCNENFYDWLSHFQICNGFINYGHRGRCDSPHDLFSNLTFAPFGPLHPFPPPHPAASGNHQSLCISDFPGFGGEGLDSTYKWDHTVFDFSLADLFHLASCPLGPSMLSQMARSHFFLFFVCVCVLRAAPAAYGSSQARGRIWAVVTSLHHSHGNTRSKPVATLDP